MTDDIPTFEELTAMASAKYISPRIRYVIGRNEPLSDDEFGAKKSSQYAAVTRAIRKKLRAERA